MKSQPIESLSQLLDNLSLEVDPSLSGYEVEIGDDDPIHFDMDKLALDGSPSESSIPGVYNIGRYHENSRSILPIVSILYNKLDPNGIYETEERVLVLQGIGQGVHPGHTGQQPAHYLIGSQIGTCHPGSKGVSLLLAEGRIEPKHFSMDCVVGYLPEPVLANPS